MNARAGERHATVRVDGRNLHVVEWGPADGPVLLALHGLRSYAETFADLAARLPLMRVIALDQRGRGRSDWDADRNYGTLDYVADLEGVVEALGIGTMHLLGHSMGGANAIVYAAKHPQRLTSLIVEEMVPNATVASAGSARIADELARTPAAFADVQAAEAFWRELRPNVTEAAIASRMEYTLRREPDGRYVWRYDAAGIAEARARIAPADLTPYVAVLTIPVLLVRGEQSNYVTPELAAAMAQLVPEMERADVPGAGHYVHDDAPELFAQAVGSFLRRFVPERIA